jgi:nicotinic acetylcholine receptor, invertebrate
VEKWLCGYLASLLRMKIPRKSRYKKLADRKSFDLNNTILYNEFNEQSSKSLLANVLDINDDFGVIATKTNSKFKSKAGNEQPSVYSRYQNVNSAYLRRENSTMSQSTYEDSLFYNSSKSEINSLRKSMNMILKELRFITQKIRDEEEETEKALNWKFAAMVIDRLCMWFFAIATFVSTGLILFTSEHFFFFGYTDEEHIM